MPDPLVESWQIHDRINAYLLAAITPTGLGAMSPPKGRTVAQVCVHLHNVRLMWLAAAGTALPAGVVKLEPDGKHTTASLTRALAASAKAIGTLIEGSLAAGGRVKGFKPHVHAFVAYLIAHEAHHRGQAVLALKVAGQPLDKKTAYGLWEWGVR